jgi:hypothetical protein
VQLALLMLQLPTYMNLSNSMKSHSLLSPGSSTCAALIHYALRWRLQTGLHVSGFAFTRLCWDHSRTRMVGRSPRSATQRPSRTRNTSDQDASTTRWLGTCEQGLPWHGSRSAVRVYMRYTSGTS